MRIVANAGGLNPAGLADAVRALAERLGVPVTVAHVEGDDLLAARSGRSWGFRPLTANAYLGAWGIVDCLNSGADIVVTGRVTDASVVVGPAAAHFGWARDDYDRLAGAVVAGHVIECGAQATGGNYAFFTEIPDLDYAGFPLAEIYADGSSVITKHPGTGGQVSVGTVTAQLLYEIAGSRYANPDVTARFDSIALSDDGPDRVRISGVRGEPPPPTLKVSLNSIGGFRNAATFVLTGLDIDAKADLVRRQLETALTDRAGRAAVDAGPHRPCRRRHRGRPPARCSAARCATPTPRRSDASSPRPQSNSRWPATRAFTTTAPPADGAGVRRVHRRATSPPTEVDARRRARRRHRVAHRRRPPRPSSWPPAEQPALPEPLPAGPTRRLPLGTIAGARSGDKGGGANVGVWVRTDEQWRWLANTLTVEKLRELLPGDRRSAGHPPPAAAICAR